MKKITLVLIFFLHLVRLAAEDGYDLWLRYRPIEHPVLAAAYKKNITAIRLIGQSPTTEVIREEIVRALKGLLQITARFTPGLQQSGTILIGTAGSSSLIRQHVAKEQLEQAGNEGYLLLSKIIEGKNCILITANSDAGVLYGVFHFLRLLQTRQPISNLHVISSPRIKLRLLNHWDNLDRSVERGYAGNSIWNWHTLPRYLDKRYKDYARANASIGINGTVLTNVNANATFLTASYLQKIAALASVFRPYGIKVYLTARFSAPIEIGGMKTADPLDSAVRGWWKKKVEEIYRVIPDFGGFLIKANSEGQPGPQNYGRNHADGANMLADAVAPFGGIVMWRAFVYASDNPEDRHKQAYNEFKPLDGKFRKNVLVQVKNGPIDFQPREPFHPLFGAMPQTPLMMEFQLTQEYLGFATHLVYMGPLFKECLDSDTYSKGKGSFVSGIVDGTIDQHVLSGMAGVANIGSDLNWCGHPMAQANWYALGRLAWDHGISSEQIAKEWLEMTFTYDTSFLLPVKKILLSSREFTVNYMTPLGLHHLMATGHHYGPAPWVNNLSRAEWNPAYYHKADSAGIGFDRTAKGSNALAQYTPEARKKFEDPATCPNEYLLWFHHLPWNFRMKNGELLWNELCRYYYAGVDSVRAMQKTWSSLRGKIDIDRFEQVSMLLTIQEEEAVWWRNACLLYFQAFSKMPIPSKYEKPDKTLEYYKQLRHPFAPGN